MSELPFDPPRGLPFRGETVVFTGKLWSFGRKDACVIVEELGGSCNDDVTVRTTLLVVGAESYPDGAPDLSVLLDDTSTQSQKLRRVAQINAETPGRIRVLSEDEFCRLTGQPAVAERRTQHYGQRDILAMYPELRIDHLRYLEKWGFIKPAFKDGALAIATASGSDKILFGPNPTDRLPPIPASCSAISLRRTVFKGSSSVVSSSNFSLLK